MLFPLLLSSAVEEELIPSSEIFAEKPFSSGEEKRMLPLRSSSLYL